MSMIPSQPNELFSRPFASSGNYRIPPDFDDATGRASLSSGFPSATQLPLNQGGVAPNRLDFNGMFYMLSSFAFWQQSGGQWAWLEGLNYKKPSLVFHNDVMWWCKMENGPETAHGPVEPGTNDEYWEEYLFALAEMVGSSSVLGNPVGTVITYYGENAPDGYFACDGTTFSATQYPALYEVLGASILPDMRGLFVRGHDPDASTDPDGMDRKIGSLQRDAMQLLTGHINATTQEAYQSHSGGCFTESTIGSGDTGGMPNEWKQFNFNSSRQARTATENRPVNINLLYCIKHD